MTTPTSVGIRDGDRSLDEFSSETSPAPESLSRIEAAESRRLESEGTFVGAALAVVTIGFGVLLALSWRSPEASVSPSTITARSLSIEWLADAAPRAASAADITLRDQSVKRVKPVARAVSLNSLNAIWRHSDTRSLQESFARLRHETLAFHRCRVQMTAADRAVAQCDGVGTYAAMSDGEDASPQVRWTLDFQRTGNKWAIQRVSNR